MRKAASTREGSGSAPYVMRTACVRNEEVREDPFNGQPGGTGEDAVKASDWIAGCLGDWGVDTVFELIGGMTTHLMDSIYREGRSRIITVHHEQAAALAACGWAQARGIPGVALATSGPGAVNLLTGVGTCYFDSVPAVFLTGQVNRNESSSGLAVRQLGFQETDIVSMARPVVKGARQASSAGEVPELMRWAFALAVEGRPGPVLLDLPMDIQQGDAGLDAVGPSPFPTPASILSGLPLHETEVFCRDLGKSLERAERPLFLVGNGVVRSGCGTQVSALVRKWGIPAVFSLMGKGALTGCGPLCVGMIGTYGNRWANHALSRCDLLLVLGSRMDIRQTGANVAGFGKNREIYQVDVDPGEIDARIATTGHLAADLRQVVPYLLEMDAPRRQVEDWCERIRGWKNLWPDTDELGELEGINPNRFMKALAAASPEAAGFVTDIGAHQMWAAQSLDVDGRFFMSSGGMGAMGYALPAAMGASLGSGGRPVVVVAGDGGFQCNIQEMQTVARNRIPLKIVVMNNRSLGMVRQFQETYFEGRFPCTVLGYDTPDFRAVAQAYGIEAMSVPDGSRVSRGLEWLWRDPRVPSLLEVSIPRGVGIAPRMVFGRDLDRMYPDRACTGT